MHAVLRNSAVALLLAVLAGCSSFSQVPLSQLAKAPSTYLVYGLDASNGPLQVSFEHHAPKTTSCARLAHASVTADQDGIRYFAFAVPPGTYTISMFYTAPMILRNEKTTTFAVAVGRASYIGTYGLTPGGGLLEFSRDLDAVRQAIGSSVQTLELAEVLPPEPRVFAICNL
ncbi:MAG: hypothetical protein ABL866_16900 [Devosia sp.]